MISLLLRYKLTTLGGTLESFVEVAERMAQHKVSALPVWDINEVH